MSALSHQASRDRALDGLRGIAILLVLANHLLRLEPARAFWVWAQAFCRSGWIGVDLFFVLSGFLITRILIQTRDDPLRARNFYARRALRILPAYFVYVLLAVTAILLLAPGPAVVADTLGFLPALLLFVQNLVSTWAPERPLMRELAHLWSLAVEEQFYLLWPWLVWRLKPAALPTVCLAVALLAALSKLAMLEAGFGAPSISQFTLTRLDGFAVGAFLATRSLAGRPRLPPLAGLLAIASVLLLALLFVVQYGLSNRHDPGLAALALSATPFAFGGLLWLSLRAPAGGLLQALLGAPLLVFFGRYSYGLYLVHFAADSAVHAWLKPLLSGLLIGNLRVLVIASASLALSVLLALLLHRLVEKPALALKRHFEPQGRRPDPPSALPAADAAHSAVVRTP